MSLYVFSKEAENDLMEIYRYGFLNYGENKADLYINALKEQCRFLSCNPFICRERKKLIPPVRIYHHKKHLIIYTIVLDYILIVRICHERMDIPQYLDN
jgi:toxin ParE1/3/4